MNGSLFLFPQNPENNCSLDALEKVLLTLGITGSRRTNTEKTRTYNAGENFSRHVIYAGCSPHLKFEPENTDDHAFCHVAIHGPFPRALILTGQNTVKPRCPHCRTRIGDWQDRIRQGGQPCPNCKKTLNPAELDWRQHAACGRSFVELRNVFPGEAAPGDQLISSLERACGFNWRYAWAGMKLDQG